MGTNILKAYNFTNLIYSFFYYLIAAVLLFSGVSKIIDPTPMIETMRAVFKVNDNLVLLAATILPITEIVLGLMLVMKIQTNKTLLSATFLFFCFFAFSIYGTAVGLNNDCGCFGKIINSQFGWGMVVIRNFSFLIIATIYIIHKIRMSRPGIKITK